MTGGKTINPESSCILTINGGSSSIRFGLFEACNPPRRLLHGAIDRIGQKQATLQFKGLRPADDISQGVKAPDDAAAVDALMNTIEERGAQRAVAEIGHRVVRGGLRYWLGIA